MMSLNVINVTQWLFFFYLVGINLAYLLLNLAALFSIRRNLASNSLHDLPRPYSGFEPPVSILVPTRNEERTIVDSVRSLLQLHYPEHEIIVVNDGSRDGTLDALTREFALIPFPEAYWKRVEVKRVKGIYRSSSHPNLRIIDKENGGKADALNAGINAARYPIFCCVDADSILERDSLKRIVEPFLQNSSTIAAGGTVRVANGCQVGGGFLERVGLPRNFLALLQVVEYLRAFLFGRLGWSPLNAVLIISGAFGLFRRDAVTAVGGYRCDTVGEDMELIVRLHRLYRKRNLRYRITFVPDPICWTEVPESLSVLGRQRVRWQRGLAESLSMNLSLLLNPKGGAAGCLAFPFMVLFEWFGPLVEVCGYVIITLGYIFSLISGDAFVTFLAVAFALSLALSTSAMLLEEMSFHVYARFRDIAVLLLMSVLENLGYRQLNAVWRLWGLLRWAFGAKGNWGEMKRTGSWRAQA